MKGLPSHKTCRGKRLRTFCKHIIFQVQESLHRIFRIKHRKFAIMQEQVNIDFDQLVKWMKQLPEKQWSKLKREVEDKRVSKDEESDMLIC